MISEIQTNFYRITLRMPYRLKHVHAYLLAQNKELALFDTGLNMPGAYETLEKDLVSIGFSINDIKHIFNPCAYRSLQHGRFTAKKDRRENLSFRRGFRRISTFSSG